MTGTPTDVQDFIDARKIEELASRYCRALDTKDWDLLDSIFTPDATAKFGPSEDVVGRDAIKEKIELVLDHLDASHHLIGNHEVEVRDDTASHRCYFQAQHVRKGLADGDHLIVAGNYVDEMVRTDDGWRIARRTLTTVWTEGNPSVTRRT